MAQNLAKYLETYKPKIVERLGKNAGAFMSALTSIYNSNSMLKDCDERSLVGAAFLATTLNLSITPSLGQAYIVPFKSKDGTKAQFQVGVHGYIQLAHRTGQYTRLHAGAIYEGELRGFNPITGEPIFGEKTSDEVAGYVAYMRLVNGFEKALFMSKEKMEAHAEKYSQSYKTDKAKGWKSSPWTTNFDEMAAKTVLKKLLKSWGVLSADMATALVGDQSVVDRDTFTYNDNGGHVQSRDELYLPEESIAASTGEVVEELKLETES